MNQQTKIFVLDVASWLRRAEISLDDQIGLTIHIPFPPEIRIKFENCKPLIVFSPRPLARVLAEGVADAVFNGTMVVESKLLLYQYEKVKDPQVNANARKFVDKIWQAVAAKNKAAYKFAIFIPFP